MRTIIHNLTVQSLPSAFAATLRQRILDVGVAPSSSPWHFDTDARQLGTLVASSRHTAVFDGRRRMLLTPPEDFIPTTRLAEKTTTHHERLQ
jgi:hypothetical protein